MSPRLFLTASLLLALAACTAGPDYIQPAPPPSPALQSGQFLRGGGDAAAPAARWWEGLSDPVLTSLIDKGLRQAPGVAAAEARVRQAREALGGARAKGLPSIGGKAIYARAKFPDNPMSEDQGGLDFYTIGFDAQWEIDLWGLQRRDIEQARARAGAAEARLADAQVSLSAEIARTYVELREREAGLALIDERQSYETRIAELARQRAEGGTVSTQVAEAAAMQLNRTGSERATMAAEITVLRDALAVLTGAAPGTLDDLQHAAIPLPPAKVVIGDPAAMLVRRPDLRAAERQLAAASAQIGIEEARQFPHLSLLGLIGIGGTNVGDLVDGSQLLTAALPRLSWNFFDFGRRRAAILGSEAGRDAALADYDAAVLSALQDAEASLTRFGAARTALGQAAEAAKHANRIAELEGQRAEAGTIALGDALEARRQAIDARLVDTKARAGTTLAFVSLVKALGLGWENPARPNSQN